MLRFEPKASFTQGKCCITELHHQPLVWILNLKNSEERHGSVRGLKAIFLLSGHCVPHVLQTWTPLNNHENCVLFPFSRWGSWCPVSQSRLDHKEGGVTGTEAYLLPKALLTPRHWQSWSTVHPDTGGWKDGPQCLVFLSGLRDLWALTLWVRDEMVFRHIHWRRWWNFIPWSLK